MNKLFTLVTLALIAVIAYAFYTAIDVFAHGADLKPNACRTYYVNSIYGGVDNMDGLFCGESAQSAVKHTSKDAPVIAVQQDNTKVTIDLPTVDNAPVVDDDTESTDAPVVTAPAHGNPGNDKPVGNAGEKCEKGMCENSDGQSGEHGNSNND